MPVALSCRFRTRYMGQFRYGRILERPGEIQVADSDVDRGPQHERQKGGSHLYHYSERPVHRLYRLCHGGTHQLKFRR